MKNLVVNRTEILLKPDPMRVLLQDYFPWNEEKASRIITRILMFTEEEIKKMYREIVREFISRHRNLQGRFITRYEQIKRFMVTDRELSWERKCVIGAFFMKEYSPESAALYCIRERS